jgi:anaerobic selenocysteine-containing dehydrogenase
MAEVLDGFEDFNARARHPHGFRLRQPARERVFQTTSGRAEFWPAPLPDDVDPGEGRLTLATVRSHDQFNTSIYSNDDRYRGLKGLRTVVFMNENDMRDRGLEQFDLVDVTSFSKDGTQRTVHGYRAVRYEIPPGCAAGYMPELNVPLRHRRLQHAERAACDEAPRRRGDGQHGEQQPAGVSGPPAGPAISELTGWDVPSERSRWVRSASEGCVREDVASAV